MFYVNQKVHSVTDGIDGMKRVALVLGQEKNINFGISPEEPEMVDAIEVFDIPVWEAELLISENPVDPSEARNIRGIYVVDKIYDIFKDLNINVEEFGYYMQKLTAKMQGIESASIARAFGKEDQLDIRISDWEATRKTD